MKLDTALSCGDKVWAFSGGHCFQYTVGQVRIQYTSSQGLEDGQYFHGTIVSNGGENHGPLPAHYEECYMCVETGIGSGSIHTIGKTIFLTKEDCLNGSAKEIERLAEVAAYRKAQARKDLLSQEEGARRLLANIEAEKAREVAA